jgi:methyl-accepting chemotaxis protein
MFKGILMVKLSNLKNVFENLKIKVKLRLFPVLFVLVMVIIFVVYSTSNRKSKTQLNNIRNGYVAYIETANMLNFQFMSLQRMFQEAISSASQTRLDLTKQLYDTIKVNINSAKANIVDQKSERFKTIDESFEEYFALAYKSTESMINGEFSEETNEQISSMIEKFNTIKAALTDVIDIGRVEMQAAFNAAERSFNLSFIIILVVLAISLALFLYISLAITNSLISSISGIRDKLLRVSTGDLNVDTNVSRNLPKDEIGEMVEATDELVERLRGVITDVQDAIKAMATTSDDTNKTAEKISESANEQASSVEEVSATMEEMTSNIENNSENARETEAIAKTVATSIRKVSAASKESLESVHNIAEKIKIINVIAARTDILAINAAVEAARAGSYGDGFAVVASEVRKLAERSKAAAEEIVSLTKKSVTVAEDSGRLLNELVPEIEKTTRLVQEIASASFEQNEGAAQVNGAIQQLNSITQANATEAEEMSSRAEAMSSQANQLREIISFFTV